MAEREFYTVRELSEKLGLSRQTIERLFREEPGVFCIDRPTTMNKRRYRTLRVPHHVYVRVVERLTVQRAR